MIPANESAHNAHIGLEDCSLPENWNIVPLRRKCFLNTGATPSRSRSDFWQGDINWFSSKDLKSKLLPDSEEKITHLAVDTTGLRLHPAGTLVACFRSGILRHTFPVAIGTEPFTVNQDLRAITLSQDCSSHFVLYYLMGMNNSILASCRKIGATVESIETKWFLDYPLVVPPLLDQQLTIDFLDEKTAEIDGLVGKLEREVELLERYRRELIAHTVTRGLDPDVPMRDSGIDWIGKIPSHWKTASISTITDENKIKNSDLSEKNLLSLSYGKIIRKDIDLAFGLLPASFDAYQVLENGYIVLRMTDLQNDKRSLRSAIAKEKGIITGAYIGLKTRSSISPDYLAWLLRFYDLAKVFYSLGGGVRQSANYKEIGKTAALVPPLEEQEQIANFLDKTSLEIDSTISNINKQIELLAKYRKQVINDTVTGRIRLGGEA
ncbi:hypothetical protein HMPREF9306_00428 [Propionimicrobium lymphophilum ACS-093-V-SCH5]|uniref:Type I restriction modification DNA specificity domain-containing protein n=2 Tax=Propionimicrobium TaxID=203133 RepID=S2W1M8_9ACTN|nr:restriction endonuclease subunit S [Propionimicrobium lymphophilum]EPD33673.1 hypothetical protein HMPREF9306_00428 [Propionimicrobium lymphophilum ACS-093-V-SCH5]